MLYYVKEWFKIMDIMVLEWGFFWPLEFLTKNLPLLWCYVFSIMLLSSYGSFICYALDNACLCL